MNRKRDRERSCLSPKETLRLFMRDSERERERERVCSVFS